MRNDSSSASFSQFIVRSALPRDIPKFAPYFSFAFQNPTETRLFVIADFTGETIGGGYILRSANGSGNLLDLHILDPKNIATAGSQLLIFLRDFCRLKNYDNVAFARSVPEESPFDKLLKKRGFESARTLTKYEVEVEKLLAQVEPVFQRLHLRGKFSAAMKIVSLRDAPAFATRELILRTIGSNSFALERQLAESFFCENTSKIAQVGPEIVGAILVRVTNGIPEIVYLAVDPNRRNSWVYAVLSREFLQDAQQKNWRSVFLNTFHPAIINNAKRADGKIVGRELNYRLAPRAESIPQRAPDHPPQPLG